MTATRAPPAARPSSTPPCRAPYPMPSAPPGRRGSRRHRALFNAPAPRGCTRWGIATDRRCACGGGAQAGGTADANYNFICESDTPAGALPSGSGILCYASLADCLQGAFLAWRGTAGPLPALCFSGGNPPGAQAPTPATAACRATWTTRPVPRALVRPHGPQLVAASAEVLLLHCMR
jgi:hypothetical protein